MKVVAINNQLKDSKANHQSGYNESPFLKSDSFSKLLSGEAASDIIEVGKNNNSILNEEVNHEIESYLKAKKQYQEMQATKNQVDRELASSKNQIESIQKTFDILLTCLKISSRIINGDNVPAKDHKLLLENYPEIYSVAMSARKEKENPENHDSLIDKESEKEEALKVMSDEITRVLETISNVSSESTSK